MAWTTPPTLTDGTVLTGAHTQIWRDDLNLTPAALSTTPGQFFVANGTNSIDARLPVASAVPTSETTASATYTNLTTVGPQVTIFCTTMVLVGVSANQTHSTSGGLTYTSFRISGAFTQASQDSTSLFRKTASTTDSIRASAVMIQTGVTAGASTFTMEYRTSGATGTWDTRSMFCLPF